MCDAEAGVDRPTYYHAVITKSVGEVSVTLIDMWDGRHAGKESTSVVGHGFMNRKTGRHFVKPTVVTPLPKHQWNLV